MKLAWLTDIHLEMASDKAFEDLCRSVLETAPDAVLLGGDIANAVSLESWLGRLEARLQRPLYFVLGNHDYYRGEISAVRRLVSRLAAASPRLCFLEASGAVALTEATGLVGHGGWGDVGYGNPFTPVLLNDFRLIQDLAGLPVAQRNRRLATLGREAGGHLGWALGEAVGAGHRAIIVLTHVPPFREACWHEGRTSDDEWAPFFACKATGEALLAVAREHPDRDFAVLCGHTHSPGEARLLPNLSVSTGGASYGRPALARTLEVS